MEYAYFATQAQPQPQYHHFNQFPPTPAHSYETDEHSADHAVQYLPKTNATYPDKLQDFYQGTTGFPGFDPNYQFEQHAFVPQEQAAVAPPQQQQHQQQQHSPPISNHRQSISFEPQASASSVHSSPNGDIKPDYTLQDAQDQQGNGSSGDEGKSLTPAQQRRKVQNRAA
jgi:hypothetical protein